MLFHPFNADGLIHASNVKAVAPFKAVENLKKESVTTGVHQIGDVMYDAVLYNMSIAEENYSLEKFHLTSKNYILGTIHRAENTDDIDSVCD